MFVRVWCFLCFLCFFLQWNLFIKKLNRSKIALMTSFTHTTYLGHFFAWNNLVQLYTSTITIWRFCEWIFFFPFKSSSFSYDRVWVSYIALRDLYWVFTIRLTLILSAKHPNQLIVSTVWWNIPLPILTLVQSIGIFLYGKEVWFCYLLCDKYYTGLAVSCVRSHAHTPTHAIFCLTVRSSHA